MNHKRSHRWWNICNKVDCLERRKKCTEREKRKRTRRGQHASYILSSSTLNTRGTTRELGGGYIRKRDEREGEENSLWIKHWGHVWETRCHIKYGSTSGPTNGNEKRGHGGIMSSVHGNSPGARKSDHKTDITYKSTHQDPITTWNHSATTKEKKERKDEQNMKPVQPIPQKPRFFLGNRDRCKKEAN